MATYNAGIVTAYGAAVRGGYTGTYEQYCEEQAHIGTNAQRAEDAADRAEAFSEALYDIVASEFDESEMYSRGKYVLYHNKLYMFTEQHYEGAWNPEEVQEIKITDRVTLAPMRQLVQNLDIDQFAYVMVDSQYYDNEMKYPLGAFITSVASEFVNSATETHSKGDYVLYKGHIYRFINDHVGVWNAADVQQVILVDDITEARNSIADLEEYRERVETFLNAAFVTDTASGAVATFSDGADNVPVKSLSVAVEAVQSGSGDPSPSNVRPISGWDAVKVYRAGKNLIAQSGTTETKNGVTFTHNDDGTITVNGTATGGDATHYVISKADMTACGFMGLKGQEVIENGCPSGGSASTYLMQWARLDGSTIVTDFGEGATITIGDYDTASSTYARIIINSGYTANNLVFKPMVRFSSETDATYEPYNGTVYDINLPQTVYGGTLDVTSGVVTLTKKAITLNGSESWSMYKSGKFFANVLENGEALRTTSGYISNLYAFAGDGSTSSSAVSSDKHFYGQRDFGRFWVYDSDYTTVDAWKSALASTPMTIVYPLTIAETITLTPEQVTTLLGQNNIYADSGSVAVTYRADTGLYIDKRLNA